MPKRRRSRPNRPASKQPLPEVREKQARPVAGAGPILVAVLAVVATLGTLGPGSGGPGITCDELYHVGTGKQLVTALRSQGFEFFSTERIAENFSWKPGGPPVHPPLGNWILGGTHHLFDPTPDDPWTASIAPARFAPALALGLLVFLVGRWTSRREGNLAGWVAAASVVLVPRVFAHGHLAALDLFTTLFFVGALLAVVAAESRGRLWRFALAGFVWGLVLLTRIHGLLLVVPVVAWLIWRLRLRCGLPLLVWTTSGLATCLVGWPWLWPSPIARFGQLLATATERQAIHVFYAGRVWDDHQVPWHYSLVMFLVALPLGLLLLGLAGAWAKHKAGREDSGYVLVMGTLVFLLLVFSWPGVPVYDGARLFLMVFPLWAVSVGVGAKWVCEWLGARGWSTSGCYGAVGLIIALQAVPLVAYHPCQLSHYNLLVGGLWGAEKLGFEVTYWGDAVDEPLLEEAARRGAEGVVLYGPNLAPFQAVAVGGSSASMVGNRVTVLGWGQEGTPLSRHARYAIIYRRRADLAAIPKAVWSRRGVAERRKMGVWLARLVELREGDVSGGEGPPGG